MSLYTRYVRILRLVLPAIVIISLLALFIWPWWVEHQQKLADIARHEAEKATLATTHAETTAPLQVMKPEYQGLDKNGRPYHITAARVEQNLNPKAPLTLFEPVATLTLDPQANPPRTVSLQALSGTYDANAQTLDLKGNVVLTYEGAYTITAEDLAVDIVEGIAVTTTPVTGQGPRGFLSAQSLNIADKGARIVLKGPSKIVLAPSSTAATETPAPTADPVPLSPVSSR